MEGIAVTGRGRVRVHPDKAVLSLGVSVLAKTAAQSHAKAAQDQQALIDALAQHGMAEFDRQTDVLRFAPEYDYKDGRQRLVGYRATNTLSVTVRAVDNLPNVIDSALAVGDTIVLHGVTFDAEDRRQLERSALEAAVADARARAEALSAATGTRLGAVTSVDAREVSHAGPVQRVAMMAAERAGSTPVEPGAIEVEAIVEVTYEIAGA
jgi:uncharacterized protein YggE